MMGKTQNTSFTQEACYPLQAYLGFILAEWKEGFCRLELPFEPFLMNRFGDPLSGVLAVLLDTVIRYGGCFAGDADAPRFTVTVNLIVSFLAQSRGKMLFEEARRIGGVCRIGSGRRTFFAEGRIKDDTGRLIATATGTFRYRSEGTQH